jgi:hypothetical protein
MERFERRSHPCEQVGTSCIDGPVGASTSIGLLRPSVERPTECRLRHTEEEPLVAELTTPRRRVSFSAAEERNL